MKKGISTTISHVFTAFITIALVSLLMYFYFNGFFGTRIMIKENEKETFAITLAQIIMSSEHLAYEDQAIQRGIFEKDKLDDLQSSPDTLFSEIQNPKFKYFIKIQDLDENIEWEIGSSIKTIKDFPVAIKYSDKTNLGMMSIGLEEI